MKQHCHLDFEEMSIEIQGRKHPLRLLAGASSHLLTMSTTENLPAGSEKLVRFSRLKTVTGPAALVEPTPSLELPKGVTIGRSLIDPRKEKFFVRMTNISPHDVLLPRDTIVGRNSRESSQKDQQTLAGQALRSTALKRGWQNP